MSGLSTQVEPVLDSRAMGKHTTEAHTMDIRSVAGTHQWEVVAVWHGTVRRIHGPADLYSCLHWRAAQERAS